MPPAGLRGGGLAGAARATLSPDQGKLMDPADAPTSETAPPPRERRAFTTTHPILLLTIIVLGTAAVASGLWALYYRVPPANNREVNLNASGFSTPVSDKLDPSFTDANGDLLADPPTDPKQF